MKKGYLLLTLLLAAVLVVACGPTATPTEEPEVEETTEAPPPTEAAPAVPEACAEENACATYAAGEPVRIGMCGPLTGDAASYGIDTQQGGALFLSQAGEFEGHAFELDAQDDGGTGDGGAATANRFAADPTIAAVMGCNFSGATNAAMPILEEARIAMMSPSATRIDLTQQGFSVFNRVVPSDFFQGEVAARFIYQELGATSLAITHDSSPYGQGLAERVRVVFEELGGTVVGFEAITAGEADYSSVLTSFAASDPDALFHGGYNAEASVLVNQRAQAGLADTPFVSGDGVYGDTFLATSAGNLTNVWATSAVPPADSEARAAFDAAYEAEYGVVPGVLSSYAWYAADAVGTIVEAIKAVAIVGDDGTLYVPREALIAALRATSGYPGITGTVTCDENGECAGGGLSGFGVYLATDDGWEPVDFTP